MNRPGVSGVAAAHQLHALVGAQGTSNAVFARVSTDATSATRGIAVIHAPGDTRSLEAIDSDTEQIVLDWVDLEDFRSFWSRPSALRRRLAHFMGGLRR